jgi:hypothetical protein
MPEQDATPPATPPTASAPKLPAFFRTIQPDESAPVVAREDLAQGAIVRFISTRETDNRTTGRKSRIHTFYARGGEGVPFALWGSAGLDSQLRKLRGGTGIVFIRYNGKVEHPTMPGRTVHKWTVQEAVGAKLDHVRKAREGFAEQEAALDATIAAAAERDKARLLAQGAMDEPPPPDDDDLPF